MSLILIGFQKIYVLGNYAVPCLEFEKTSFLIFIDLTQLIKYTSM